MKSICLGILFSLLLPAGSIRAANEAGPIPSMPWLHEGMMFTSTWMQAHVPGNEKAYHENGDGRWVDDYGNIFAESDLHGTSAGGITQLIITCVDHDRIAGANQGYADARALGLPDPLPLQNATSFIVRAGQDNENWINPAHLAAAKSDSAAGILVESVQWKWIGASRDAIRIGRVSPDGYSDHVYDKKTGICVHYAISAKTSPTPQALPIGVQNQGDTVLTQGDFLSERDLKVPWSHEDLPDWVSQFKALHYRGQITFRHSSLPQIPNEILLDAVPVDHGNGWMSVKTRVNVNYQNLPTPPTEALFVSGRSEFGGFWAGPKGLATLHQGDILDEDPITKMRTVVSAVSDQSITMTQSNNSGEIVSEYDKQSGLLTRSNFYTVTSHQDWGVRLQGRE